MKKVLLALLVLIVVVASVILIRTFALKSQQRDVATIPPPALSPLALRNFQAAIAFQTISYDNPAQWDSTQFLSFRQFLENTYPLAHQQLSRTIVQNYTLLYRWEGQNNASNPIVLMAHQDVVPVEPATETIWTVSPFEGTIKDDYIWGRGTTDDKINLISIMESVEKLLKEGFKPKRTIYLVFGHDEESGGTGAREVARMFKAQGIRPDLVLDEGGMITREKVPGLRRNVAIIGTSEKGWVTLELKVEKGGGHSAMPEPETAITILAEAITRLNENRFEARFSPSTQDFVKCVGPELPFTQRMAFANLWLFESVVHGIYEQSNGGNAMIRTTLVPTVISAGVKANVVPTSATAIVNLRLLPGDSSSAIQRRIREIINDDRVLIEITSAFEASGVTSMESFAYTTVDKIVRQTYDSVIATPFLMIAATDSRFFNEVSDGVIKFSPMVDPIGFHGIDERVSLDSYQRSLWFFEQLIRDL